jgi:putative Mg2+ transporter-C (MgtC) family protein
LTPLSPQDICTRIGAALLCGALVGIERERKHRPAGFRTMILISLGCCGFVLIGVESVARIGIDTLDKLPPGSPIPGQAEISRILQGLMGGIGFVGAGAVLQSKKAVRGITTAAAVWVVAALGSACGLGLYLIAVILSLATLFTLIVLESVEDRYFPDPDDGNGWPSSRRAAAARMIADEAEEIASTAENRNG